MRPLSFFLTWQLVVLSTSSAHGQHVTPWKPLNAADHRLLAREGFDDYDWSFSDVNRELGNALRSKRQSRAVAWVGTGIVAASVIIVQQQLNVADGSFALGYGAFYTGACALVFTPTFSILKSRQAKRHVRQGAKLRKARIQSFR